MKDNTMRKKLIEVALPLEAINAAAAYEKMPGIGAHPRGIHLWWARRPLAAARAVIWASLVDDPSSHPEEFPSEEAQNAERERLFRILSELVKWENSNNQDVLNAAKAEIMKSTDGNPPALLDPFAGGGAIPLEAQRLGLEAHASDLNPVAVMINKAMIEIPPKFAGLPPVTPEAKAKIGSDANWTGASGLAEDVRYYGKWMKDRAFERIGHLYPKVKTPKEQGGGEATVIAWIWTRTVKCPNPACGCEMPLASSFELSKKKGKEAYIQPCIENNKIRYEVKYGNNAPEPSKTGRGKFKCIACGQTTPPNHIHAEYKAKRGGVHLMAIVAEGKNGRLYFSPDSEHIKTADCLMPEWKPEAEMNQSCTDLVSGRGYGFTHWHELFTNRQLTALTTFSDLVKEAQKKAEADAVAAGMKNDSVPLADGGTGATAYAQAVGVYLAFAVDRLADFSTSVSRWAPANEKAMNCFSKQAIPMTWDFPEVNILGTSVGGFTPIVSYIADCILKLPVGKHGEARQNDAQSDNGLRNIMMSTDPPYYDNIGYADLSDFFYVWLRQSLKETYPELFRTMLVPKSEELVATPYRFDGSKEKANAFFESGMLQTFKHINTYVRDDVPTTVYYAYKQSEKDDSDSIASTGWETMLSAIIQSGFAITGTWPMRTEQTSRMISMNTNALASSIVLVCRKRLADAGIYTRRDFIDALKRELKPALTELQRSNIAPVDLAQAAIGPGMAIYSRFSKVVEANGSPMGVRSALQIINQELDIFFTEQDGELDRDSRFCVALYTQCAFNGIKFGEADVLARAKDTSVARLKERGLLYAEKGVVRLLTRNEISEKINNQDIIIWQLTQQLTRAMEEEGIVGTAKIVADISTSEPEQAKSLAYRLFQIAERAGWAAEAHDYNSLVIEWPDVQSKAAELRSQVRNGKQMALFDISDKE
jgi:putative DNA methylase